MSTYWFRARKTPGDLRPAVYLDSHGPETSCWSLHRTMLGARFRAWRENRKRGLRHGR